MDNQEQQSKPQAPINPILWIEPIVGAFSPAIVINIMWSNNGVVVNYFVIIIMVLGAIGAIIGNRWLRKNLPNITSPWIFAISAAVWGNIVPLLLVGIPLLLLGYLIYLYMSIARD